MGPELIFGTRFFLLKPLAFNKLCKVKNRKKEQKIEFHNRVNI
jgi:hypothetical protein